MFTPPPKDCPLCPRLVAFREQNTAKFPDWHNAPVPSFGPLNAQLLVIGLAPGLKGANRTGRPFTGDYAGVLLYQTLKKFGFARGEYKADPNDGYELIDCRITNAVRCVPPENKPLPAEQATCNKFLISELADMPNLKALFSLGSISHNAVLTNFKLKKSAYKFAHGAMHLLPNGLMLFNSYHCSRYNTQTKRLTDKMFEDVVADIKNSLDQAEARLARKAGT